MNVPLLDLKAQYATIRAEVMAAIEAVVESQVFNIGPAVRQLEKTIADYCGCAAAVGMSSGTDALLAALMALNIGPGDEVITTPFTFFATAGCISRVGARPVFVDIQPDSFNLDPAKIEPAISPRTRAIMPVHLYGQLADMDPIMRIAQAAGLHVIEDAAQAVGAARGTVPCSRLVQERGCPPFSAEGQTAAAAAAPPPGKKAGSFGAVGCLSFYPTKNLGAFGDGGMIVTQDVELAEKLRVLRDHGQSPTYYYKMVGGNFRLDNLQAAVLGVKMRYLDRWTAARRAHAALYDRLLADCPGVVTPKVGPGNFHIYNQYVIRVRRRDALQAFLKGQGIGTGVYYPLCLHQQECFLTGAKSLGYTKGDFPESERAAGEVLALPVYPELTDEQINFVAGKIREFMAAA